MLLDALARRVGFVAGRRSLGASGSGIHNSGRWMSWSASSYQRIAPQRAMNTRCPLLTRMRTLLGAVEMGFQSKCYHHGMTPHLHRLS